MRQTYSEYFHEPKREQVADIGRRIAAFLIDHLLAGVVIGVVLLPIILMNQGTGTTPIHRPSPVYGMFFLLVIFLSVVYLFIKDGLNGQGVGKRVMRLKVIRVDSGVPIGFGVSALRYLFLRVLGLIEIIFILIQPNHRGLGDWLGNSMVIGSDTHPDEKK